MDSISRAIDLSLFIQKAISLKNWQEVAKLDSERLKLIDDYFRTTKDIDEAKTSRLKEINDQIVGQLISIQQQTQNSQLELKHGRHAARAYLDTAAK